MSRYHTKLLEEDSNEVAGRIVRLSSGGRTTDVLRLAGSGNGLPRAEQNQLGKSEINELTASFRLSDLRRMDGDIDLQSLFVRRKLAGFDDDRVNLVVLRIRVARGQRIEPTDAEYAWDILQAPQNDVVIPPILSLPGGAGRIGRYTEFLSMFLEEARSFDQARLGALLPHYTHHSRVRDVLAPQLEAGATFLLHDLGGRIAMSNYPIVTAALRVLKEHSADDFFLYGYDPKPYKQSSATVAPNDVSLWAMGFTAFGPRHTVPPMPKWVVPRPSKGGIAASWARVIVEKDYGYHRLDDKLGRQTFEAWLRSQQSHDAPSVRAVLADEDLTKTWTRAFNRRSLNMVGVQFEGRIREHTLAGHLRTKRYSSESLRLGLRANRALYRG